MLNIPSIQTHQLSIFFKFLFVTFILLAYLAILHKVLTDHYLRKLFIQSLSDETGRVSGKSISACVLVNILVFSCIVAVYYDEHHLMPSEYLWSIVSLIVSLYGIKEVGQYTSKKFGISSLIGDPAATPDPLPEKKEKPEGKEEINSEKGKGD